MRKSQWRESGSGPSMIDVEAAMRAIGSLNEGMVSLTVLPLGTGATGGLRIVMTFCESMETVNQADDLCIVEADWPERTGRTFEALSLALIYALDNRIELLWKSKRKLA